MSTLTAGTAGSAGEETARDSRVGKLLTDLDTPQEGGGGQKEMGALGT